MKKKIRDLLPVDTDIICKKHPLCACCPLEHLCCDTINNILRLVQDDMLNVLLNQEVEIEGENEKC